MDWKKKLSKLPGKMTKENWIVLLCLGLLMMIIGMPWEKRADSGNRDGAAGNHAEGNGFAGGSFAEGNFTGESFAEGDFTGGKDNGEGMGSAGSSRSSYEMMLEDRVKEVLKRVEGVGTVDVLIVLKSSEERIYRTDGKTSRSTTKELDSSGGSREISEQEEERTTVLSAGGSFSGGMGGSGGSGAEGSGPLLEKEMRPEISGIVISAQGGGSPAIKAEITEAMEALFDLPAHKIKVLKRVE